MAHFFHHSIAFGKLDTGPPKSSDSQSKDKSESSAVKNKHKSKKNSGSYRGNQTAAGKHGNQGRTVPICLLPACPAEAERHYIRNCPVATDKEKEELGEKLKK